MGVTFSYFTWDSLFHLLQISPFSIPSFALCNCYSVLSLFPSHPFLLIIFDRCKIMMNFTKKWESLLVKSMRRNLPPCLVAWVLNILHPCFPCPLPFPIAINLYFYPVHTTNILLSFTVSSMAQKSASLRLNSILS